MQTLESIGASEDPGPVENLASSCESQIEEVMRGALEQLQWMQNTILDERDDAEMRSLCQVSPMHELSPYIGCPRQFQNPLLAQTIAE